VRGKQLDQPYIQFPFTYQTVSPYDYGVLYAGDEITDAKVIITTPFNDPAAMLTLGQTSMAGNIFASNELDPTTVGTYENGQGYPIAALDGVRLQVIPGASTQGAGIVQVSVRRN
jgi:hypothetical protein